jgi:hypothetical protein
MRQNPRPTVWTNCSLHAGARAEEVVRHHEGAAGGRLALLRCRDGVVDQARSLEEANTTTTTTVKQRNNRVVSCYGEGRLSACVEGACSRARVDASPCIREMYVRTRHGASVVSVACATH